MVKYRKLCSFPGEPGKGGMRFMAASSKKHSVAGSIGRIILLALLLTIVFLLIFCIAYVHGKPAVNLENYKNNQAQTSILYAKNEKGQYTSIAKLHGEKNRIWVSLDSIPKDLQNSFISLEDKRFYDHHGVDWIRTIAAVVKYHGRQGGSTLTQQLIKNLTDENQVTVSRKAKEILEALNLEKNYSKKEILEAYLNTIPLGSGCYGVQTASEKYFGKEPAQLDTAECACLASITQAPTYYNPLLHPNHNTNRRNQCLNDMRSDGFISEGVYQKAIHKKMVYTNSPEYVPTRHAETTAKEDKQVNSYYVDYVIDTVIKDFMHQYNLTRSEATQKVYSGGLRIYTTENPKVQEAAESVYENRIGFPSEGGRTEDGVNNTKKKVQSACTIMDYQGNVVAMVGGAGKKTLNRSFNRATDAVRSPGSSIKPLSVYTPAMEKKYITYSTPLKNAALDVGGRQWPRNFDGGYGSPSARVTTQYALAESLNTTSARLAQKLTPSKCMKFLIKNYHFSTLVTSGKNSDANLSSMAVGGMSHGVTTLEMCAAYATFGNGGKYYAPHCYTKVTNYKGDQVLLQADSKPEQAISKGTADAMNKILQTVVTQGTGKGCGVSGFTTFMKTGTTSDTKDKWACGGTPYYVGAFWFGYDTQEEITYAKSGYNPAAHIFSATMTRAHRGKASKSFTYGKELVQRAYCTYSGELAGRGCPRAMGWYDRHNLPDRCDGTHSGYGIQNVEVGATSAAAEGEVSVSSTSEAVSVEGTGTTVSNSYYTAPSTAIYTQPPALIRRPH